MTGALTIPPRAVPIATLKSSTLWPHPNPSLLGHAVGVASAAEVGPDDLIRTDATGRKQYRRAVSFESGAVRQHWTRLVLSALAAAGLAPAGGEAVP